MPAFGHCKGTLPHKVTIIIIIISFIKAQTGVVGATALRHLCSESKYLQKRKKEVRPVSLIKVSPHPVCFSSQMSFFVFGGSGAGLLISTGSRQLLPLSGLCLLIFPRRRFLGAAELIRLQCKYPYLTESCLSRPTWTAHYNMARRQHAGGGVNGRWGIKSRAAEGNLDK